MGSTPQTVAAAKPSGWDPATTLATIVVLQPRDGFAHFLKLALVDRSFQLSAFSSYYGCWQWLPAHEPKLKLRETKCRSGSEQQKRGNISGSGTCVNERVHARVPAIGTYRFCS